MEYRLEQNKGLSTGRRNWLDKIIDEGVPAPKNATRVNELLEASEVDGMQESSSTLRDFAYKLSKGWSLSEKQEIFLSKLLIKSENMKAEGRFRPTPDIIKDLVSAVAICKTKNGWYWNHRPGTAKSYDKVNDWLDWSYRKETKDELEALKPGHTVQIDQEPIIDKWSCDKLLNAVKKSINELKHPRHPEGTIAWTSSHQSSTSSMLALITGVPTLDMGTIVYPCLIDGETVTVRSEDLKKRRAK